MQGQAKSGGVALRAAGVGVAYGLIAYLCLSFTRFGAPIESIWISNALLAAALLKTRVRDWAVVVACAAGGHLSAHLATGDAFNFSAALLAGDMFEAVTFAALLIRRPATLAFQDRNAIFYFLAACVLCAFASALVATTAAAWFAGRDLKLANFVIWFSADALALAVFMPLFAGFNTARWLELRRRPWTLVGVITVIVVCNVVAAIDPRLTPLRFLALPVLVWGAFDLGVVGVEIGLAVLFSVWVGLALLGKPPTPWVDLDMRGDLVVAQLLLAMLALTVLPLAVVIEERQRLNAMLADCLKETREAWGAVIGAEARYRLVVDYVSERVMRVAADGAIVFASPACASFLHDEVQGQNLFALIHPDEAADARERFRDCIEEGLTNLAHRWRWRRADGNAPLDLRVTLVAPNGAGHEEFVVVIAEPRDL
jgi:PAS domain S-box-containing protein